MTADILTAEIIKDVNVELLVFPTPPDTVYPKEPTNFVVNKFRKNPKVNQSQAEKVRIAASELIANAIEHGNNRNSSTNIKIACGWLGNSFHCFIQDEGKGFDINSSCNWYSGPERGMGLPVTRRNVDVLENFEPSGVYFKLFIE